MKIEIADIPDEGLELDIDERPGDKEIAVTSPVRGTLSVRKIGGEITVSGTLKTEIVFECSRCLKDSRREIEIPVGVVYHSADEVGSERHELKNDEMDMSFYQGETIDIGELVTEQVLLSLDMKPLCRDDCRGLCPSCGADLNMEACGCGPRAVDPRFEALKHIMKERKE